MVNLSSRDDVADVVEVRTTLSLTLRNGSRFGHA